MLRKFIYLFTTVLILISTSVIAQDDLMDLIDEDKETTEYAFATFKTTRIVTGQSIENPAKNNLLFIVSHQFGRINSGASNYFGFDQATIRLGFEYGVTDWLALGIGRSSKYSTIDGFLKVKLLRQSTGLKTMPVAVSYFTNMTINTKDWKDSDKKNEFTSRLQYAHQILIARKFTSSLSLQLMPTFIHRNLVETKDDQNNVFAIGAGGRIKITNQFTFNMEYYYLLPGQTADDYKNSLSIGFDIDTGGHVFQIYFTNSQGLIEEYFVAETTDRWLDGNIHLAFNIKRTFVF